MAKHEYVDEWFTVGFSMDPFGPGDTAQEFAEIIRMNLRSPAFHVVVADHVPGPIAPLTYSTAVDLLTNGYGFTLYKGGRSGHHAS